MEKDYSGYRFTYFSSLTKQTVSSPTWKDLLPSDGAEHLFPETSPSSHDIWWLDVRDPTEQDVEAVSQFLDIHPLTAEDVISRETREKVEPFRDYYLVSFQTLVTGEDKDIPSSAGVYILVFRQGTVTFSPSGCGHVRRVQERIRRMHDPTVLSAYWICYALM